MQIDDMFDLFSNVKNVVDLCAAPGSWSQVLSRRLYLPAVAAGASEEDLPRIVAIDLQPMAPIEGITILQGDITSKRTAEQVISYFDGNRADIVISDGAPDVTGLHDLDEYVQAQLILAALVIVSATLKKGGKFVAKVFRGRDIGMLYSQLKVLFGDVTVVKPKSSRNSSIGMSRGLVLFFKGDSYALNIHMQRHLLCAETSCPLTELCLQKTWIVLLVPQGIIRRRWRMIL